MTSVHYDPETGHFELDAVQPKSGDFGKACFMIWAVLFGVVGAYLGLEWAATQVWIGQAVQYIIGGAVALFILVAVIGGVAKH